MKDGVYGADGVVVLERLLHCISTPASTPKDAFGAPRMTPALAAPPIPRAMAPNHSLREGGAAAHPRTCVSSHPRVSWPPAAVLSRCNRSPGLLRCVYTLGGPPNEPRDPWAAPEVCTCKLKWCGCGYGVPRGLTWEFVRDTSACFPGTAPPRKTASMVVSLTREGLAGGPIAGERSVSPHPVCIVTCMTKERVVGNIYECVGLLTSHWAHNERFPPEGASAPSEIAHGAPVPRSVRCVRPVSTPEGEVRNERTGACVCTSQVIISTVAP